MKVGIIGAGNVGSATAFALVMRGVARKVVLIDANEARAKAEAADIAHASPFADASKIKAGTYEDLKGAEVVIITAGANQNPENPARLCWNATSKFLKTSFLRLSRMHPIVCC